jgi:hypothetical protein
MWYTDGKEIKAMLLSDYKCGKRDAAAGYYDKWYRYNRKDNGEEYDAGWQAARKENLVPDDITFIPGC